MTAARLRLPAFDQKRSPDRGIPAGPTRTGAPPRQTVRQRGLRHCFHRTGITRNIIYETEAATVFLEMDHGPTLVDNNILRRHCAP